MDLEYEFKNKADDSKSAESTSSHVCGNCWWLDNEGKCRLMGYDCTNGNKWSPCDVD